MYSFLPDELVKEILAPALQIPDSSFASTAKTSPFAKYQRSTSAYLLVCKDWLRVATPLLYNVVVLRSKAQIQALAWALKSTPQLARFIKKLRIECSYSAPLFNILQASIDLTDLCLSLEIYSQDSVTGICKGLPWVRPRRIIVYDPVKRTQAYNQNILSLVGMLVALIPEWTSLVSFILPNSTNWKFDIDATLVRALCKSRSLQEVGYPNEDQPYILQLAKIPTLKRIFVHKIYRFWIIHNLEPVPNESPPVIVKKHPELADLVCWRPDDRDDADDILLPRKRTVPPPSNIDGRWFQECPSEVLENILIYAMDMPEIQDKDSQNREKQWLQSFNPRYRQGLMLVCKRFHEVGIRLFYQCILVQSSGDLSRLAKRFETQRELGELARSFFLLSNPFSFYDPEKFAFILSCCSNLRRMGYLDDSWLDCDYPKFQLDWQTVSALALQNSAKLVDLEVHIREGCGPSRDLAVLLNFNNLKTLDWHSDLNLHFDHTTISKSSLCYLERLACSARDITFLSLMSYLDLPRLHSAHFPRLQECPGLPSFLGNHGPKLRCLEVPLALSLNPFETCPNLKVLIVPHDWSSIRTGSGLTPRADIFNCSQDHLLEEIKINTIISGKATRDYFAFLGNLNLSRFKVLRRIQIYECSWPTSEHEIKRSFWVPWAERLQELYSVQIVDRSGKAWVPRLKLRGRGGN